MFNIIRRIIMAISAAKQAFLDALAGVKQKIDTGDDTFSETEMAAVTNLVNEKVAGVTAGLTTQVAELVTKVAELTANDADTDEFIDKAAAILKGGGSVEEAIAVLDEAPTA
jgi:hypothetical protein